MGSIHSRRARRALLLALGVFLFLVACGTILWKKLPKNSQQRVSAVLTSVLDDKRDPWRVSTIDESMAGDVKAIGDLDGDGFVDLVIGGKAGIEDMVWYQYPKWTKYPIIRANNEFTTDMQLADIDRDGDLDIVVADGDGQLNVQWLENPRPKKQAPTTPWARHAIGSHGTWVHDIAVADFDRDGRIDVATRKDSTKLWFANPEGAWKERDLSKLVGGGEGLGLGDVDADGDHDLLANCAWFENPADSRRDAWLRHPICTAWDDALTAVVADFDRNGAVEVAMTSQHKALKLSIFSHAGRPTENSWQEHVVDTQAGSHKLNVGDFDLDGQLDMQAALEKVSVVVYLQSPAAFDFRKIVLPKTGHNLRVADVGHDGDLDLFGAEYAEGPPTRLWENLLSDRASRSTAASLHWTMQKITNRHERTFGLAFADIDRDKRVDVVSGRWWYKNEGAAREPWPQHPFPAAMHACLTLDVDGDEYVDVIAQKDEGDIGVYWLEQLPEGLDSWASKRVGDLPRASHEIGAQGQAIADLELGGRAEIVMTSGRGAYYFAVPADPAIIPWNRRLITAESSDEGLAVADVDRDGRIDVVTTSGDTKRVEAHLNPGRPAERWKTRVIAKLPQAVYLDRLAAADFNRDGRMDVAVTEENGLESGAATFWFEQPADVHAGEWPRHLVVSQATTHSLDVGDVDGDGDMDLTLGEHRGSLKLSIWDNDGAGKFTQRILSTGRESHLGARLVDLDSDQDLDVVSIAWDDPETIFVLWNGRAK